MTDGQTDGHLHDRKDRPAYMQRGKNGIIVDKNKTFLVICLNTY